MFIIKFWQNINEVLFKPEYLVNFSQYFGNFEKAVIKSGSSTFSGKVSNTLAEFYMVFSFEKFLIYAVPKNN